MNIKTLAVFILGMITGIFLSNLFKGCNPTVNQTLSAKPLKPDLIKTRSEKKGEIYQHKIDSLKGYGDGLAKKLFATKQTLSEVKKKNTALQMRVFDLMVNDPLITDTAQTKSNCDSLKLSVSALLQSDKLKDSLFTEANMNLEEQVKNKDSTLIIEADKILDLQISFDQSLSQQQLLYDQVKTYQKQFRRQKLKSKLVSVGALILSGMTAAYLIQH